MKIKKIKIENFKSIVCLEIDCNDGMNAFVGKNGTGKSAVFDAVNFVLGERYPMPQSFERGWFNDKSKPSSISNTFDDLKTITFNAELKQENNEYKIEGGLEGFIKGAERDKYRINYLGADRSLKSIMPTNGWSLLGKVFYSPTFFDQKTIKDFKVIMENAMQILQGSDKFQEFQKNVNEEFGNNINKKINAKFALFDKNHFLKSLEFYNDREINLTDEGSGIQNSFIIACLKALSKIKGIQNNPIFIDEPELYLHPHAKKALYKNLEELAQNETQIFYITHSAEFLSFHKASSIYRFWSDQDGTKVECGKNFDTNDKEKDIDIENNKISFNSAFFAERVFVVEGFSDYLFLQYVIKTKTDKEPEELDISIINALHKNCLIRFYNIYHSLKIKTFILFDKDKKGDDNEENKELLEKNSYGFEDTLESFLGYEANKNEKTVKMQKWINFDDSNMSEYQNAKNNKTAKIDEIWNKIKNFISINNKNEKMCEKDTSKIDHDIPS